MSNGFYSHDVLKNTLGVTLGASLTKEPVSKPFHITASGSLNIRIDVVADDLTAGAGVSFLLETSSGLDKDGNEEWITGSASIPINAEGTFSISLNVQAASDIDFLPLRNKGRIVVTTGAGSAVTIKRVSVLQAQ